MKEGIIELIGKIWNHYSTAIRGSQAIMPLSIKGGNDGLLGTKLIRKMQWLQFNMIVLRSALKLIKIKCPFYEASQNIYLFVFLWSELNRKLNLKLSLTAKPNTILCSSFDFVQKISLFLVFHSSTISQTSTHEFIYF